MKKRIKFKYNKYSPWLLYVMLIVGVTLGLLVYYLFLVVSGINQGPYGGPEYFRNHTNLAILVIFGLIPVAMLVPTFLSLADRNYILTERGSQCLYRHFFP